MYWHVHQLNGLNVTFIILQRTLILFMKYWRLAKLIFILSVCLHYFVLLCHLISTYTFIYLSLFVNWGLPPLSLEHYIYSASKFCIVIITIWEHHHFGFMSMHILWYLFGEVALHSFLYSMGIV